MLTALQSVAMALLTTAFTSPDESHDAGAFGRETQPTRPDGASAGDAAAGPQEHGTENAGTASATASTAAAAVEPPRAAPGYLSRPLLPSARFVYHGVLQVAIAGGTPHKYRVELGLGLLDHVTLGVTAHWLPGQERPRVAPRIALAFWRWRYVAVGAVHHWTLYPPPVVDLDVDTPSYQQMAQWYLGTLSFGQRFVSAGMDAGIVRVREDDPGVDPGEDLRNASHTRVRFGGGVFLRAGTRRWGVTAQALLPHLVAEVAVDVRFGLFERRPKGEWWPRDALGRGGVQRRPWQSY